MTDEFAAQLVAEIVVTDLDSTLAFLLEDAKAFMWRKAAAMNGKIVAPIGDRDYGRVEIRFAQVL